MLNTTNTIKETYSEQNRENQYTKLYHYTSFDTFVRIWLSQQLKFGSVLGVNDLEEGRCDVQNFRIEQFPLILAYEDLRRSYKQISLMMDDDSQAGCMSPLMWGHYGDKSKGVCIEFNAEKLHIPDTCFAGKVMYQEHIEKKRDFDSSIQTIAQVREYIKQNKDDIFFTKLKCWEAENEYRIISNQDDFLNIKGAISTVYLTSCESMECIFAEELVSSAGVKVKFIHPHSNDRNNEFRLIASDIHPLREQYKTLKASSYVAKCRGFYEKHKDDENFPLILQ